MRIYRSTSWWDLCAARTSMDCIGVWKMSTRMQRSFSSENRHEFRTMQPWRWVTVVMVVQTEV